MRACMRAVVLALWRVRALVSSVMTMGCTCRHVILRSVCCDMWHSEQTPVWPVCCGNLRGTVVNIRQRELHVALARAHKDLSACNISVGYCVLLASNYKSLVSQGVATVHLHFPMPVRTDGGWVVGADERHGDLLARRVAKPEGRRWRDSVVEENVEHPSVGPVLLH